MTSISFLHLVIAGTQLVCCEFCFFPAPPQKVVVLLPTFLQSDLFQLRISEFSVNKEPKTVVCTWCLIFVLPLFTNCCFLNVSFPTGHLNLRTVSPETPWLILPHPATTAVLFWMCWCPVGRQTVPLHIIWLPKVQLIAFTQTF